MNPQQCLHKFEKSVVSVTNETVGVTNVPEWTA